MKVADNLIDIKALEKKLLINLDNWNNEDYMSKIKLCDKVKLSKKIDSLNHEYSVSLAQK
jgi:hypothetical protein